MARTKFEFTAPADIVWAATAIAFSLNKGYVKTVVDETPTGKTNRQLVEQMIKERKEFTHDEIQAGVAMRDHFKGYAFKLLCGRTLNAWEKSAHESAECDTIESSFTLGVICALPSTYEKEQKRASVDSRIQFARGGYIADLGQSVQVTGEVLKIIWSEKWGTYYVTMITPDDQVVFFPIRECKEAVKVGKTISVKGTVKAHRDNSTQLNRVKVI